MNNLRFNAEKWCQLTGVVIIDPDGWDRSDAAKFDADWNKVIDFSTFMDKTHRSTTYANRLTDDQLKLKVLENLGFRF